MCKDKSYKPQEVTIRRGLLVSLVRTAHALCRKSDEQRIAFCKELLEKVDSEVDWRICPESKKSYPIDKSEKQSKKCPYCGSSRVIYFTADDDICQDCNKWFPGT